jgi:S-DNA-T family DNA segregation ATPase FtsK/SpoIIIE
LPRQLPGLWDALVDAREPDGVRDRLLLLDDLDAIVASCEENYRAALIDLFSELLRDTPGVRLAVTVQRVSGALQPLVGLCGSLLLLRLPSRQEHVLAGGSAADFSETLPPGGAHWRGHRVQVFATEGEQPRQTTMRSTLLDLTTAALTVVSSRPGQFADRLRGREPRRSVTVLGSPRFDAPSDELAISRGGMPPILVADPDTWQTQWSLFGTLQRETDVLFDGCSLAELRAISRSRELPPPFDRGQRTLWLRPRDGQLVRARLD